MSATKESPYPASAPGDTIRARLERMLRATARALPPGRAALVLLALAAIYRLILLARGWPALDSDEAVIGLMARHILHGERPTFFWGQDYMGPFEAYVAALLFLLFGPSTFVLGLSALLLTLGFLAIVYALGRAAYGSTVGLLALAWLVLSPPFFTLRQLAPIGGYEELLLLGGVIVLGVWSRLRLPDTRPTDRASWLRCIAFYAALGYLAGLGFWSDLLILPVLLVAAGALVIGRWREVISLAGVALALAFIIGAWPYISFNIATGNATYRQLSHQNNPAGWPIQTFGMLSAGLPVVGGSPHICITQGNIWDSYPPSMATLTAKNDLTCQAPNILISLAALTLLGVVTWQLGRWLWVWLRQTPLLARGRDWLARRGARIPPATEADAAWLVAEDTARERARRWLRAMLLGIALMTLVLFCASRDAAHFQFTSARYLLPIYLATPLFVGVLWEAARKRRRPDDIAGSQVSAALIHASWKSRVIPLPATLGLLWLLASSLYGAGQTLGYAADGARFGQPIVPVDRPIIAFMDVHHLTAYYTNDYWACYRVAFEAQERLHCTVRGDVGAPTLQLQRTRYQPWVDELLAMPHPAYLLILNSVQDQRFAQLAAAEGLPHQGYTRAVVGPYAIYYFAG